VESDSDFFSDLLSLFLSSSPELFLSPLEAESAITTASAIVVTILWIIFNPYLPDLAALIIKCVKLIITIVNIQIPKING